MNFTVVPLVAISKISKTLPGSVAQFALKLFGRNPWDRFTPKKALNSLELLIINSSDLFMAYNSLKIKLILILCFLFLIGYYHL